MNRFVYTAKIEDSMKFVYLSKLEQNVNFIYTKLGDISLRGLKYNGGMENDSSQL